MHRHEIDAALVEQSQAAEEGRSKMKDLLKIIVEEHDLPEEAVELALAAAQDRELAELDVYSSQDVALNAQWKLAHDLIRRAGYRKGV